MIKDGFLSLLKDFSEFKLSNKSISLGSFVSKTTPSIYFVVDSTLRFGNTLKLIDIFEETTNYTKSKLSELYSDNLK